MLTDFEFFIATLPDWDGKDRVSELEKLVEVKTGIYMHKDYHFFVGRWVSLSIIKARDGDSGLIFLGKQKDKAKSQGKETEEPKEKAGAEAAASGKSVSQSADKHASQTNGNKDNESANVSTHSSEDSQKSNKEK